MEYTPAEEELLNEYYPLRTRCNHWPHSFSNKRHIPGDKSTGYDPCEDCGNPEYFERNGWPGWSCKGETEWEWAGEEYDELIPWTFSSSDNIGEEEFLVLHNAWNCESSLSFTSTDRFPPVEDSIHESYEYIVKLHNKLWRVSITENMGVHGVWCVQSNLEHIKIEDIKIEVHGESWSESQPNTE